VFILDVCTFTMHLEKYISFPIILYYYMNKYKHYFEKQQYCCFFFVQVPTYNFILSYFIFHAGMYPTTIKRRKQTRESVYNNITQVMANTLDMDVVSAFQYSWGRVHFEQDDFSLHKAIYYCP